MPSKRMGVFDEREPGLKVQVYVLLSINTDQTELTKYAYNPIWHPETTTLELGQKLHLFPGKPDGLKCI